jgi:hypothetical protein
MIVCQFCSCNTTKTVYQNKVARNEKWVVQTFTLSHCGCTDLYVNYFDHKKLRFQIHYTDTIARKTIFDYSAGNKNVAFSSLLATQDSNNSKPFDETDRRIFAVLDSIIDNQIGIIYPLTKRNYKGYTADTLSSR